MGACQAASKTFPGDDVTAAADEVQQRDDMIMSLKDTLKEKEEQISSLDETLERERGMRRELKDMMADLDDNFVIIGRRDVLEDTSKGATLPPDGELCVLLFGMTGCGKSSLGNLIIGDRVFLANDNTASVTNLDSLLKYEAQDGSLTLLDTIGMGDTELTQEQVAQSIRDVALQARNGIDVLFFVMKNERLTDDAIARFIYITQFCWGEACWDNLYIVVTHASRYATDKAEAHDWINRNAQINWRFKHIYTSVGNNPNRFIFIDNPSTYSNEPLIMERQRVSCRSVMNVLAHHNRDIVPPFTNEMMKRAVEMSKKFSESVAAMKKKEKEIADLKTRLELVCTGKSDETDPEKLKALEREAEQLEEELGKVRLQKLEQKKKDSLAFIAAAKADKAFNVDVEKEAEKARIKFTMKFRSSVVKGATASAAVVDDVAKACWNLASRFKVPMRGKAKDKAKKKEAGKGDERKDATWLSDELLEQVKNIDPKMKAQLLENAGKDMADNKEAQIKK